MTNYVVFRVAKLKSRGNIAGAAAHNLRHMSVPNADPERRELNHIRGPKTVQGVLDAYDKKNPRYNNQKKRSHGVGSPDYCIA